jgi:hypothetical protein
VTDRRLELNEGAEMPNKGGKLPIGQMDHVAELRRRAHRARLYTNLMIDAEFQAELLAYAAELEARATTEATTCHPARVSALFRDHPRRP